MVKMEKDRELEGPATEKPLILIKPRCSEPSKTERLNQILDESLKDVPYKLVEDVASFRSVNLKGRRLLFAISLGQSGVNLKYYEMLKEIRLMEIDGLEGSVGGLIVDGNTELYTKSVACELVFAANRAGCSFVGRPLVEGTRVLYNFNTVAKLACTDNLTAYRTAAEELIQRLLEHVLKPGDSVAQTLPKILMLHAGDKTTSSTLALWGLVEKHLQGFCSIKEISLRDGEILDCSGCPYETCFYLGKQGRCIYGGVIVEKGYPSTLEADALVLICPNYNDALGANLTAYINRLTALFWHRRFYDKKIFAIIVSGYSGGNLVAEQIISAMNMNKSFFLPPRFALIETANTTEALAALPEINERAEAFASDILDCFLSNEN